MATRSAAWNFDLESGLRRVTRWPLRRNQRRETLLRDLWTRSPCRRCPARRDGLDRRHAQSDSRPCREADGDCRRQQGAWQIDRRPSSPFLRADGRRYVQASRTAQTRGRRHRRMERRRNHRARPCNAPSGDSSAVSSPSARISIRPASSTVRLQTRSREPASQHLHKKKSSILSGVRSRRCGAPSHAIRCMTWPR